MPNIPYTIIIYPITQIIEFVFVFAQKLFKQTGLSIISVSFVTSVLCLPLYIVAENWQKIERNIQKQFSSKITKIKTVFKGDEQYMILSTFYRQNNYHPIYALRSTFGLLIQIPFFIAAYSYLSHLESLQGSSFFFIRDLGKPDMLIPVANGINFLPLLMTLINCIAGVMYTYELPLKDKVQVFGISLVFLFFLYNSSSGLVLYWTLNNIFSLVKNAYFKITLPSKLNIVKCFISILCAIVILYILFVLRRDIRIKTVMTSLFLFISIIPWLLPVFVKFIKNIPCFAYSKNDITLFFIFSFFSVCILTGILIPSMLIGASPIEFSHIDTYGSPLFFIANTFLQTFGFFVFWPLCLYFLFSSGIKKVFAAIGIIFFVNSLFNAFLFPGSYGLISIDLIFDSSLGHKFSEMLFNLGILCIVSIIVLFLFFKAGKKVVLPMIILPLVSVSVMAAVNINNIQSEYKTTQEYYIKKQSVNSIEPLFQLSRTGKNTVIIMLDRATSAFFPYILSESPLLTSTYSGFIYYPNTVSFNGYTRLGAPPLFGGYEYSPKKMNQRSTVSMREKHNEALLLLPRIFSEAGYNVTITDPPYPNYSQKADLRIYEQYPEINAFITDGAYTEYWLNEHNMSLPSQSDVLKRNIFWYSLFKIMPYAFREGIYQHGGWFAPFSGYKFMSNLNWYSVLDYLPYLTGISSNTEKSFLFIVNNITHEALYYQAPEYRPIINVTNFGSSPYSNENEYHTNISAIKRIGEWLDYLKSENIYDNTRIIIVSDHGAQLNYVLKTGLPFNLDNLNPLLLVKDFNSIGQLKTDNTFMSNADVPFLAVDNQIEYAKNPWTGKPITADSKKDPLYIALSGGVHLGDPNASLIIFNEKSDFYIHDNIFDENNWVKADK